MQGFSKKIQCLKDTKRYTHLDAEFQRIERRAKKHFLSEKCKEIEENNRKGKMYRTEGRVPEKSKER